MCLEHSKYLVNVLVITFISKLSLRSLPVQTVLGFMAIEFSLASSLGTEM